MPRGNRRKDCIPLFRDSLLLVDQECSEGQLSLRIRARVTYTDGTGNLMISIVLHSGMRETYESTKAETGIKNTIGDIGKDDILRSSSIM